MKYLSILIFLTLTGTLLKAQRPPRHSCDNAYRFDASYSKAFDQLENVSIFLNQPMPAKEKLPGGKRVTPEIYYYASGDASSKVFQSLDANIGFLKCYVLDPNLELYKTEVKNRKRTFTIPAGSNGNQSANIPIQIITPFGQENNGIIHWGPGNFEIKFVNGYLSPGEYILIDKYSITPDGTQMKGYAFSIR